MGNVYVPHWKHLYSWERITQKIYAPLEKDREQSHDETDVWHIWKVDSRTIRWDLWSESNELGRFFMETTIFGQWCLSHAKAYVFSDSVLCLGRMNQNPESSTAWEEKLTWFKSSSQYRTLDTTDGEPMEFEWNISQDSPHCSSATKSKNSCLKWAIHQNRFKGRIIFMSMLNDISWGSEDNEQECNANADLVSIYARRFSPGRWSFLGLGSEKKWILLMVAYHKENGTESLNWWW